MRGIGEVFREAVNIGTFAHLPYSHFIYLLLLVVWIMLIVPITAKFRKEPLIFPIIVIYSIIMVFPWQYQRIIPFSLLLTLPVILFLAKKVSFRKNKTYVFLPIYVFFIALIFISIFSGHVVGFNRGYKIWFEKEGDENNVVSTQTKFWTGEFVQKAPEIISKYLDSKRVLTSIVWSNYLIWHLPNIKVTADGMNEFYTQGEIENELNLVNGTGNWKELIEELQIDTVVRGQELTAFSNKTPAHELANWKLVYVNEMFAMYAKREIIRSLPVDLSKLHPELSSKSKFFPQQEKEAIKQLKELLKFDPENGFAREQLILNLIENQKYEDAERLASESRNMLPNNPYFSLYLATIKALGIQCGEAHRYFRETENNAWGNLEVAKRLEAVKNLCP